LNIHTQKIQTTTKNFCAALNLLSRNTKQNSGLLHT